MATPRALPQEAIRYGIGVLEPANWTPETVRPPAGKEIVATGGVIWEPALELDNRPREVRPRHAKIVAELTG